VTQYECAKCERRLHMGTNCPRCGPGPVRGVQRSPAAASACIDCGLPYSDFGMDLLLPRRQWLAIHPDEHGLLCARCIVKRASSVRGAVVVHAVIEVDARGL
jgi:hypothetical protein